MLWFFFIGLPLVNGPEHLRQSEGMTRFLLRHSLYVVFFYVNYFYFIPVLFKKKGLGYYAGIIFVSLAIVFLAASLAEGLFIDRPFRTGAFMGLVPLIQVYALSTTFRLILDYFMQLTLQKKLEEQNRLAELSFLRSQINPHFLFNTLNNINALIRLRPAEAEKSLGALSDIMRYMLNTGKVEKIELGKEIEYLNNYVGLQKIRLPKDFKLDYIVKVENKKILIEPLLLIGFIENTFKHGVSSSNEDFIEITIATTNNTLSLTAKNKIHSLAEINNIISGIGLENTKKRLALCYKGKYYLDINTANNIYHVNLKLEL